MTTTKKAGPKGPAQKTPVDRLDEQYGPDPWPSPTKASPEPEPLEVLPRMFDDEARRAAAGDPIAWGRLYGMAEAYVRGGRTVPEPLATLMAQRLQAVAKALTCPEAHDLRKGILDAVAPAKRRVVGVKPSRLILLDMLAADALRIMGPKPKHGERKRAIEYVARLSGYAEASVTRAVQRVRKQG